MSTAEDIASVRQAGGAQVIPTSETCHRGAIGPSGCISVPPVKGQSFVSGSPYPQSLGRWTVDGKMSPGEYIHAKTLKGRFEWSTMYATGDIYLQPVERPAAVLPDPFPHFDPNDGNFHPFVLPFQESRNALMIYLKDIPMNAQDHIVRDCSDGLPGKCRDFQRYIGVLVDHNRFTGASPRIGPEDRLYVVDMVEGTQVGAFRLANGILQPVIGEWTQFKRSGACHVDSSTTAVRRCSGELRIPLPDDAFTPPMDGIEPGIGLAIVALEPAMVRAAFPANINAAATTTKKFFKALMNRSNYETVLFSRPKGWPLKMMTWNVARSKMIAQEFKGVSNQEIGWYLAKYDVVSLQEAWNDGMVIEIVQAANAARAEMDPPRKPFHKYGPVGSFRGDLKKYAQGVIGAYNGAAKTVGSDSRVGWDDESAGLYVLTPLTRVASGYHRFNACAAEDCLAPKGVQWVRLRLQEPGPNPDGSSCNLIDDRGNAWRSCGQPFSGDQTIDIFNMHTQANNYAMCHWIDENIDTTVVDVMTGLFAGPALLAEKKIAESWIDSSFNCDVPLQEIHDQQFTEASEFMDAVMQDQQNRSVVITGDMNVDGRNLDVQGPNAYSRMLVQLGVADKTGVLGSSPVDDSVSPWPDDFSWDIDHGDVAREQFPTHCWSRGLNGSSGQTGTGTFVGTNWDSDREMAPTDVCNFADDYNGGARYDYVLVRPPSRPKSQDFDATKWVIARGDDDGPVWYSPLPLHDGNNPFAMSDHKPVVASLRIVPMGKVPKYHPNWKHDVRFRAVSVDLNGYDDGTWSGGAPDPYSFVTGEKLTNGIWDTELHWFQTNECSDQLNPSYPANSCMASWTYSSDHVPSMGETRHFAAFALWEAETGSDSPIYLFPNHEWSRMFIDWPGATVGIRGYKDFTYQPSDVPDVPVVDMAPISMCTSDSPYLMCMQFSARELPPGGKP